MIEIKFIKKGLSSKREQEFEPGEEYLTGGPEHHSLWIIPFGNLMTILMIFFLILYAYTFVVRSKDYHKIIQGIEKELMKNLDKEEILRLVEREMGKKESNEIEINRNFTKAGLKRFSNLVFKEEGVKIILNTPILFDLGKAKLKKECVNILDRIIGMLKNLPNDIIVEGYTDNLPIKSKLYRSNWDLSLARAHSVVKYFLNKGIDPKRLSLVGYGQYRPLYPNDTPEHRALNRRIEITLVKRK